MNRSLENGRTHALSAVYCVALLAAVACTSRVKAAAGISDALATEGCWLRPPYALLKCQSDGGRYKARLVRGRRATVTDLFAYDGIVPLETVENEIERVALTTRFAVMETGWGGRLRHSLIDLTDEKAQTVYHEGEAELSRYLVEHGEGGTALQFQTFEVLYRDRSPSWTTFWLVIGCGLVVLSTWIVCWLRHLNRSKRQRRGTTL